MFILEFPIRKLIRSYMYEDKLKNFVETFWNSHNNYLEMIIYSKEYDCMIIYCKETSLESESFFMEKLLLWKVDIASLKKIEGYK